MLVVDDIFKFHYLKALQTGPVSTALRKQLHGKSMTIVSQPTNEVRSWLESPGIVWN